MLRTGTFWAALTRTGYSARWGALVGGFGACALSAGVDPGSDFDAGKGTDQHLAFVGASLVPMDREVVLPDHTVLVADGRIVAVGPDGSFTLPSEARIIEAAGGYLLPGLADMHVHIRPADAARYLAAGVTTVRNLWGYSTLSAIADDYAERRKEGPSIYTLSPGLDGTPAKWPETQLIVDVGQVEDVVDQQIASGYGTLKLYQDLRSDVFDEIIRIADERGLRFGGHVPHRVGLERALAVGYSAIEHFSGYELYLGGGRGFGGWAHVDESRIPDIAAMTAAAGVWNCPTMTIALQTFGAVPGSAATFAVNRRRMVKALHDAGAGLLVGTDSGIDRTIPGTSLHDELQEFVEAGLTPYEALRGATTDAAVFLGQSDEFGRIGPGVRADLVLLARNPLADISTVRDPIGVLHRGHWHASPEKRD